MDAIYQGFCDLFYIISILQKALRKAKVRKTGIDHIFMYDQIFACWSDAHDLAYRSKTTLSGLFNGSHPVPEPLIAFYEEPEHYLSFCQDLQNNILSKLPNHTEIVREIFEALDADDHLIDEKRSQFFALRDRYFSDDRSFTVPEMDGDALLNWEAHLLSDMILLVIKNPVYLREGKDHVPTLRPCYAVQRLSRCNMVPDPYYPFYGRTKELAELDALFKEHQHIFLTGFSGLGKSELAKIYAERYRKNNFQTFYIFYTGNLTSDILHMANTAANALVPVSGSLAVITEKFSPDPKAQFANCMDFLRSLTPNDLIVIDNFDALPGGLAIPDQTDDHTFCDEPLLAELMALRCRLLISTRCDFQQLRLSSPYHCMEVRELDMNALMQLFTYYYPDAQNHTRIAKALIRAAFQNTLLVKMTAKLLQDSFWSPEQVLMEFKKDLASNGIRDTVTCEIDGHLYSQTISRHLDTLLKLCRLQNTHMEILRNMSLMPLSGVSRDVFRHMTGLTEARDLQQLIYMGFIQRNHKNILSMHPLLRDMVLHKTRPDYVNCSSLLKNLNQVCVKRLEYRDFLSVEVSGIIESLVPCLATDLSCNTNLRGYFHFIQDAIPFQYSYGRMESSRVLLDRLEALLKLPDFNLPLDRLILNATRILIEENHKEDLDQKFERIFAILGASPLIAIDYHFMGTLLQSMIYCVTRKKGEKMYAILDNVLSTVSCHASSKLVRLFCYPVSVFIGQKELSKRILQLPAHEEADCSVEQMNAEIETLLLEAPAEEPVS